MTMARYGLLSSAAQAAILAGGFARLDIDEPDLEKGGGGETSTVKEMLGQMITSIGDMAKRMDAIEARGDRGRKDGDEDRMDKGRKDGEEDEEDEDERKDKARRDARRKDGEDDEDGKAERLKMDKGRKDGDEDDEERRDRKDARRKDAEEDERKDKARRDARRDGEEDRMDKGRKDGEEDDRKDARHDSVTVSRAAFDAAMERIGNLERTSPVSLSDADLDAMTEIQARADAVYQGMGQHAPRYLPGESALGYRRRLARELQPHSKTFRDMNLGAISDPAAFTHIEQGIYADAQAASMDPTLVPAGTLRTITRADPAGRMITSFVGDAKAGWLDDFSAPVRAMKSISNSSVR